MRRSYFAGRVYLTADRTLPAGRDIKPAEQVFPTRESRPDPADPDIPACADGRVLLTVREAAAWLGVTMRTLGGCIKRREVSVRGARCFLVIDLDDLKALNRRRVAAAERRGVRR